MATTYKTFLNNDITSTRTLLHEAIPITGTIVSGTYSEGSTTTSNIKNYGHQMFQSVYDYPYLSSSANHIFDLTVGIASDSSLSASSAVSTDQSKKINIYNQMAQLLVGHDVTGNIRQFDQDGDLTAGTKMKEVFFVNFARLLNKDELKKGSVTLQFLTGGTPAARSDLLTIADYNAQNEFRINSPAGEYAVLYTSSATPNSTSGVGHIYYQAGIAVLTASIFGGMSGFSPGGFGHPGAVYDTSSVDAMLSGAHITASCDGLRNRWYNIQYNNTTELNSTIYFCRANHNDFNYSTNPTYLTGSKIRVKTNTFDMPVSYITTVGLYSADNELLAVAKVSEPIKKQPDTELTLRVRLDY
jgi:hypothetical protein